MEVQRPYIPVKEKKSVECFYTGLYVGKDVGKLYDDRADIYDNIMGIIQYQGARLVSKEVAVCFNNKNLEAKKILDIGAGTGLLAVDMVDYGFVDIDALDPSDSCLEEARKKNIYRNLYCCCLTSEPTPNIQANTYDAIVSSGSFVPGHVQVKALKELKRIIKPGGWIVFTLCDPNYEMNYMEELGTFIRRKEVELVTMKLVPYKREYSQNFDQLYAYVIVLKVL